MRFYKWILTLVMIGLLLPAFLFISCDKKDEDDNGAEGWWPPAVGSSWGYRLWEGQTSFDTEGTVISQDSETFPGETYTKIEVGDFTAQESHGFIVWLDLTTPRRIGYKAAEMYWADNVKKVAKSSVNDWDMMEIFTPPLYIKFDGNPGQTQTSQAAGTYYWDGDMTDPFNVDMTVETTLIGINETVAVPLGEVTGCLEVFTEFTETTPDWSGSFDGTYYLHSDYGVVLADLVPGFNMMQLLPE